MHINLDKVVKIIVEQNSKGDRFYIRFHIDSQQKPETKIFDTELEVTDFLATLPANFIAI